DKMLITQMSRVSAIYSDTLFMEVPTNRCSTSNENRSLGSVPTTYSLALFMSEFAFFGATP
ncbi:MAG TPA: hypothetical protein VJ251_02045, partial [Stellaceae bacterium]|nr:hypothetical protein [Stellaceae bacterium]